MSAEYGGTRRDVAGVDMRTEPLFGGLRSAVVVDGVPGWGLRRRACPWFARNFPLERIESKSTFRGADTAMK